MIKKAIFYLLILLVIVYCTAPIFWQAISSLKPDTEIAELPPIFPVNWTKIHYISVFNDHPFLNFILNSLVVAVLTTILSIALGSLAAFAFAKLRLTYKRVLLGGILAVSMFPPISIITPLYLLIKTLGMRDTWWALIITNTTFSLPMAIWILTNFFSKIPDDLYSAARIDGCNILQIFYRIFLPLAAPGIFAVSILIFIFSWNEFLFALTFTSTKASMTIPVGIALFPGIHELPWGDMAAASIIVTIPLILIVFIFQKRIVEGLTSGAVKG